MHFTIVFFSGTYSILRVFNLSQYLPKGTEYFYGYPAGDDSGFFNGVPPSIEELVSARPLFCAGDNVKVVVLSAAVGPEVLEIHEELGNRHPPRENIIAIPPEINIDLRGKERNSRLKPLLKKITSERNLIMAQPFNDPLLEDRFQIKPGITIWCNDKKNMEEYIPQEFRVERYMLYNSGDDFRKSNDTFPLPCVVKVSPSSSGDGVRICKTGSDVENAKEEYKDISCPIIIEECLDLVKCLAVQFGVSHDRDKTPEIIGASKQLIDEGGMFMGGIVDPVHINSGLNGIGDALVEKILPKIRKRGWYGIGGFDILLDKKGKFHLNDPNFRMTWMTPFVCEARNNALERSILTFMASFDGGRDEFMRNIVPLARNGSPERLLIIKALTKSDGKYRMNMAMFFDDDESMRKNAKKLLALGLKSSVLERIVRDGVTV